MITLDTLKEKEEALVKKIDNTSNIKKRLLDLGLIKGTKVKCLFKSPLNDPIAYLIRGTIIAIRKKDSKKIYVERV